MAKDKVDATSLFGSMQKITKPEPAIAKEEIKKETTPVSQKAEEVKSQNVSVDTVVEEKPVETEVSYFNNRFVFNEPERETKDVRKCFLITKSMNEKFAKTAKSMKISENQLFNMILEQAFK